MELAVAFIMVVVAWQIDLAVAPAVMRRLRSLKHDVDEATEQAFAGRPGAEDRVSHSC